MTPEAGPPRILVADDEPLIVDLIQAALEDGGFVVRTAFDGAEALAWLQDDSEGPFAGLVTDVRLGEIDGWAVAARGRELNAALAVVYVTGDSGHAWCAHGVPESLVVGKPFASAQIVAAVTQLLNAPGRGL